MTRKNEESLLQGKKFFFVNSNIYINYYNTDN